MVTKAVDENLLRRIQKYVANDVNSQTPPGEGPRVKMEDVYILSFTRVLNNWKAFASASANLAVYYEITHDGSNNQTIVNIYTKQRTQPAVI